MAQVGAQDQYFAFLADGQFKLQRNVASGEYVFYPRQSGRGADEKLEWVDVSGLGTVYSTTVVRQRPEKGGAYNVALIDLDEGVRMMSRVVETEPESVQIGMRVRARIAVNPDDDTQPMVEFVPEAKK